MKVQQRYSQRDPAVQLGWVDTASTEAAGASSVEHTLPVTAGGAADLALVLDPLGIPDLQVAVKANAQGSGGDAVTAYVSMPP